MMFLHKRFDKLEEPIVELANEIGKLEYMNEKELNDILNGVSYILREELDKISEFIVKINKICYERDTAEVAKKLDVYDEHDPRNQFAFNDEEDCDEDCDDEEEFEEECFDEPDDEELGVPSLSEAVEIDSEFDRDLIGGSTAVEPSSIIGTEALWAPNANLIAYYNTFKSCGSGTRKLTTEELVLLCCYIKYILKQHNGSMMYNEVFAHCQAFNEAYFNSKLNSANIRDLLLKYTNSRISDDFFKEKTVDRKHKYILIKEDSE